MRGCAPAAVRRLANFVRARPMRAFFLIWLVVPACCWAQPQSGAILFGTTLKDEPIEYWVSDALARKQPTWDPASAVSPLSTAAAVEIARKWVASRNPQLQTVTSAPREISFTRVSYSPYSKLWYCVVRFDINLGGDQMYAPNQNAVMLLDGSIVEPRPAKR
jgi:hypothetical protein